MCNICMFIVLTAIVKYAFMPVYVGVVVLTHLFPGEDYWAHFYNFLHMNPSDDQMNKYHIFGPPAPSFAYN